MCLTLKIVYRRCKERSCPLRRSNLQLVMRLLRAEEHRPRNDVNLLTRNIIVHQIAQQPSHEPYGRNGPRVCHAHGTKHPQRTRRHAGDSVTGNDQTSLTQVVIFAFTANEHLQRTHIAVAGGLR